MATYLLYAWPTVLLSVALGLALGGLTRGRRRRRSGPDDERDALRRLVLQRDRDLADRDSTIAILREELAAEAAEAARLRRLLAAAGEAPAGGAAPSARESAPGAGNGVPGASPSVFAVAARRATAGVAGLAATDDPLDGGRPRRPVPEP